MLVTVQSATSSCVTSLPDEGQGAYWICDAQGARIAFAEAEREGWRLTPAEGFDLRGCEDAADGVIVPFDDTAILAFSGGSGERTLVCRPATDGDKSTRIIGFASDAELTIGRADGNVIRYASKFVSSKHARLSCRSGAFFVEDLSSSNGVFVDGLRILPGSEVALAPGAVVSILGLHIAVGDRFISLNDPEGLVTVRDEPGFVGFQPPRLDPPKRSAKPKRRMFYPALRLARSIERKSFVVDAPPAREKEDETPIAMRVGPSLVMAMASILSASVSVMFVLEQGSGMMRAVPMLAMAVAMLAGSVLWPIINKRYQAKKAEQSELQRRGAYSQYLGKLRSQLLRESELQRDILEENRLSPDACLRVAAAEDAQLMSRTPLHKDYLELRIGRGTEPLVADIRFPDSRFEVEEDDLRDVVDAFAREPHVLADVPLGHSLIASPVLGVVGPRELAYGFVRNALVQIAALHAYSDVKVVVLCDEADRKDWEFMLHLPHLFTDDGTARFFASSLDEASALGMGLEKVLEQRMEAKGFDAREANPYFVLVCPSKAIYDKSKVIKDILDLKDNLGFSVIACADQMHGLPKQCRTVIGLEGEEGYLLNRDDPSGTKRPFVADRFVSLDEAERFVLDVSKVRLDLAESSSQLPDRLSFLQMFGVGTIDYLNVAERWRANNASDTLATSIGVDSMGDPFLLNLHEDFHGPHGLIAGTTGSGKSEFIITYVLSMALNYSPEDVAFVLIDYKGGGLAKAFDNDRFLLPHIAGTITNLDGSAITRSLSSIKSELRRRQRLFNETREVVGGDNIDIYKYLDLFRQGRVSERCPHLILIADEFAELKQQEPEFMDELISASRIGRSLGVHLILATQKPSGVVNDQIWSNSRFKVSLKVADAADSQEMIRRPDAAEITQAGRFFLMVGYNEYFDIGQSGYTGTPYVPGEDASLGADDSVSYISDAGRVLLSVKPQARGAKTSDKSQIVAVAEHIVEVAASQGKAADKLWMPPLPPFIALDDLELRYGRSEGDGFDLDSVIGEYDDPANQAQGLLTLPLSREGNAVVYGTPDSGVELVLKTMLCSLISQHSARTLNAYILDFGSQSLTAFASAPQVGDVILLDDEERIKRFFAFMAESIASRRAAFAPYGGSYARYCEQGPGCPAMLVVINGISAFLETYSSMEEDLIGFAREAAQAGIRLVITGEGSSAVRMRLRNHFRQVLACDLPIKDDYVMLFGSMQGVPIPHGYGRGLVRMDDELFEFQTASICGPDESEYEAISALGAALTTEGAPVAPAVPMPPEQVPPRMLAEAPVAPGHVPCGIYDDTLGVASFDLGEAPLARVAYLKRKEGGRFLSALIEALVERGEQEVAVLDLSGTLEQQPQGCSFCARKDEFALPFLLSLGEAAEERGGDKPLLVVATGIMDFLNRCPFDEGAKVKELLRGLEAGGPLAFLLADAASDTSYTFEDWFKAHLTTKEGLWVGPGLDGQSAINTAYHAKLEPDANMDASKGYLVDGGMARLVHLVSAKRAG